MAHKIEVPVFAGGCLNLTEEMMIKGVKELSMAEMEEVSGGVVGTAVVLDSVNVVKAVFTVLAVSIWMPQI